jgi:hypothetical protein
VPFSKEVSLEMGAPVMGLRSMPRKLHLSVRREARSNSFLNPYCIRPYNTASPTDTRYIGRVGGHNFRKKTFDRPAAVMDNS